MGTLDPNKIDEKRGTFRSSVSRIDYTMAPIAGISGNQAKVQWRDHADACEWNPDGEQAQSESKPAHCSSATKTLNASPEARLAFKPSGQSAPGSPGSSMNRPYPSDMMNERLIGVSASVSRSPPTDWKKRVRKYRAPAGKRSGSFVFDHPRECRRPLSLENRANAKAVSYHAK